MKLPIVNIYEINTDNFASLPKKFICNDHMLEVDATGTNKLISQLNQYAIDHNKHFDIIHHQVPSKSANWANLNISFSAELQQSTNFNHFVNYRRHPQIDYENFICSFNGSDHVSRKLLVSILQKFGYFSLNHCSKNFTYTTDILDGHIHNYVSDNDRFFRKFFISADSEAFFQSINSFGHVRFAHNKNIYNLELKLTKSFLHIVSETIATSYVPFITEKFLYSIVTRGLFLSYAQPNWHAYIEKYYGFKLYTRIFNYQFDSIQNPVERLVELITMISKFSRLSPHEWHDLYLLEQDTIEYNYDHYFSKQYFVSLEKYND